MIGNSLPRRCGIATFATDLHRAISNSRPSLQAGIVAMTDHDQTYDYPGSVVLQIKDNAIAEYVRAAAFLNAGRFDIVCLQHEFGIFGGEAGAHILELLSRLTMPVVTTLHTVLEKPTPIQRAVMDRIVEASSKIVVMANKGRDGLIWRYDLRNNYAATPVVRLNPPGRDGVTVTAGVWETSGIIDAEHLYGRNSWLFDVQAHPPTKAPPQNTVEDGQLLLLVPVK